jgi:hypothetical protein
LGENPRLTGDGGIAKRGFASCTVPNQGIRNERIYKQFDTIKIETLSRFVKKKFLLEFVSSGRIDM